jgi:hypothetical protein
VACCALRAVSPAFHSKSSPSALGYAATQSASGRRLATPFRGDVTHLCRVVELLEVSAERFIGDEVYALCGEHHHQAIEFVLAFINSESPWTWLGPSRRRMPREHEQEPRSAKVLNGAPPGCQLTTWGASSASQDARETGRESLIEDITQGGHASVIVTR